MLKLEIFHQLDLWRLEEGNCSEDDLRARMRIFEDCSRLLDIEVSRVPSCKRMYVPTREISWGDSGSNGCFPGKLGSVLGITCSDNIMEAI